MKGKVVLLNRTSEMKTGFSSKTFAYKPEIALGYFGNREHRDAVRCRLKKEADVYL